MVLCGCAEEQKVVGVRGGIYNMPGAVANLPYDRPAPPTGSAGAWDHLRARFEAEHQDLEPDPLNPMRARERDNPARVIVLLHSPRHLVINLREAILANEWELIQDQMISQRLKDDQRSYLRDPLDALRAIARNRRSVVRMLDTMPDGDQTPGIILKPLGGNTFRLSAPGGDALELPVRDLDMVIEDNQFRILAVR
jgi:hypothetical protein